MSARAVLGLSRPNVCRVTNTVRVLEAYVVRMGTPSQGHVRVGLGSRVCHSSRACAPPGGTRYGIAKASIFGPEILNIRLSMLLVSA